MADEKQERYWRKAIEQIFNVSLGEGVRTDSIGFLTLSSLEKGESLQKLVVGMMKLHACDLPDSSN